MMRRLLQALILGVLAFPMAKLAYSACQTISLTDVTKVSKTGDTMNGDLTLENSGIDIRVGGDISTNEDLNVARYSTFHGSATFKAPVKMPNVTGTVIFDSSVTVSGAIGLNNINGPITVQSSSTFHAPMIVYSSVTANRFYGDGSQLTGVNTSGNNTIGFVSDNFLPYVDGSTKVFTLTSQPSHAAAIRVVLDGLLQSSASDYTYTAPTTITMATAPALNSYSFFVQYSSGITAVLTNGTNCSAGSYPLGVDAGGNVESCTTALDLAANNVLTGQNRFTNDTTFTDSVYISAASTIGPQGYATAVTKSSGTFNNMWMVVASFNPVAASAITFTGLTVNKFYRLHWTRTQNTSAGRMDLTFNGNSGSNYKHVVNGINTNNGVGNTASNADSKCILTGGGGTLTAATQEDAGWLEFVGRGTRTIANGQNVVDDGTYLEGNNSHCRYSNDALSSISLAATAGTFTGYFYLEEFIVPNP